MDSVSRFEATLGIDPEEWLKQFRLVAKLSKWDQDDWVDLVQLKLGKRELIWYRKNVSSFSDWTTFTVAFKEKFSTTEDGYMSYDILKGINQSNYESIEEFEFAMENALEKAGITEATAKYNWLVSALCEDVKSKVREMSLNTWDKVIKWVLDKERHERRVTTQTSDQDFTKNLNAKHELNSAKANSDSGYDAMLEKMEEWSLNLLSKVDEAVERRLSENRRKRYTNNYPRVITCFHCRKEGHKRYECPRLKENDGITETKRANNVNFLEVSRENDHSKEILAVQHRGTSPKQTSPYSREEFIETPKKVGNTDRIRYVKAVDQHMDVEEQKSVDLKKTTVSKPRAGIKKVSRENDHSKEILAVQHRGTSPKQTSPYSREEFIETPKKVGNTDRIRYVKAVDQHMDVEEQKSVDLKKTTVSKPRAGIKSNKQVAEEENIEEVTKPKVKTELKMAEGIQPFSLVEQLAKWNPTISFPQLMSVALSLNSEMISLCKKTKKQEINEIRFAKPRTTNCRIIVSVYSKEIWAVVDTGAACSVATPRMIENWGLEVDEEHDQVIITADGMKQNSLGTVKDVPLRIGNCKFAAKLTIMQRKDNSLILGMDWLMSHHAQLNIRDSELRLPLERIVIIVPLHMQEVSEYEDCDHSELFLMIKENMQVEDELRYNDSRIDELKSNYEDIFADDIEDLTQTEQTEHRIVLKDETPVKLKPYRIPHHLTMRNRTTKHSPAEMLYGVKLSTPAIWIPLPEISDIELAITERIEAIKTDIPELRNVGLCNSNAEKEKEKVRYDKGVKISVFKEGDVVLKLTEQPMAKLEQTWEGPYKVDRRLNKGAYIISDSEGNRDLANGDMLKHYHQSQYMLPEVSTTLKSKLLRFRETRPAG
ncbi:hypothetical protein AX774_g804, partial [Zancudomyces culisetae]